MKAVMNDSSNFRPYCSLLSIRFIVCLSLSIYFLCRLLSPDPEGCYTPTVEYLIV